MGSCVSKKPENINKKAQQKYLQKYKEVSKKDLHRESEDSLKKELKFANMNQPESSSMQTANSIRKNLQQQEIQPNEEQKLNKKFQQLTPPFQYVKQEEHPQMYYTPPLQSQQQKYQQYQRQLKQQQQQQLQREEYKILQEFYKKQNIHDPKHRKVVVKKPNKKENWHYQHFKAVNKGVQLSPLELSPNINDSTLMRNRKNSSQCEEFDLNQPYYSKRIDLQQEQIIDQQN